MTSQVRYRFKNAVAEDSVSFDGAVIQIGDVKRLIAVKRGLGAEGAAELTLLDPSSNEEHTDDGKAIPRNTLVLVKRAPAAKFKPLHSAAAAGGQQAAAAGGQAAGAAAAVGQQPAAAADEFGGDYYSEHPTAAAVPEDEVKALQSLLHGTASTWQREVRQGAMRGRGRGRGGGGPGGGGGAPYDYRCPRWVLRCVFHCCECACRCCRCLYLPPLLSIRPLCATSVPDSSLLVPLLPACLPPLPLQMRGRGPALGAGLPHPG